MGVRWQPPANVEFAYIFGTPTWKCLCRQHNTYTFSVTVDSFCSVLLIPSFFSKWDHLTTRLSSILIVKWNSLVNNIKIFMINNYLCQKRKHMYLTRKFVFHSYRTAWVTTDPVSVPQWTRFSKEFLPEELWGTEQWLRFLIAIIILCWESGGFTIVTAPPWYISCLLLF